MKEIYEDRFLVSVKVGPKGQITIPKEARRMFDIKEGETLVVIENNGCVVKQNASSASLRIMLGKKQCGQKHYQYKKFTFHFFSI